MVKKIVILVIFTSLLQAENIYEKNCIPCHRRLPTSLQQMYMAYLASYSGEKNVKTILRYYLKHPTQSLSAMSELFTDSYGIKEPTTLSNEKLDKAIDIYWEKFKVFDKLE